MADPGIDPRYAAQFQRGFDPAQHPPVERRGPMRIEVPRAVAHRVPEPPPLVARPPVERPPARQPADDAVPLEDADEFPAPRPRTEWAVLVIGVLLLAAGGMLFWGSVEVSSGFYQGFGANVQDQVYLLAVTTFPGPLLVAGVVAVCLWIALRAVRLPKAAA